MSEFKIKAEDQDNVMECYWSMMWKCEEKVMT